MDLRLNLKLHPYDGRDLRFRHVDPHRADGLGVVAQLLGLDVPPAPNGVFYELCFYSGGIGVLDRLAISLPANPDLWNHIAAELHCKSPEEACADAERRADVLWLIKCEDPPAPPASSAPPAVRAASIKFINQERRPFQTECLPDHRICFAGICDVNAWVILWGDDHRLNYRGFNQG